MSDAQCPRGTRQGFAREAFARLWSRKQNLTADECAAYARIALELPMLVRRNGLELALNYLDSSGKERKEHALLAADLRAVLGMAGAPANATGYMFATRRALDATDLLKRFAESVIGAKRGMDSVAGETLAKVRGVPS